MAQRMLSVVLHIDEAARWPSVLANLLNLNRDYPEALVRVVVTGDAVFAFQGPSHLAHELRRVAGSGAEFIVDAHSLLEHRLDSTIIPDFIRIVPSGVMALAEAQSQGFAYIKP